MNARELSTKCRRYRQVAAELAEALEDIMACEGGEPSDEPGSADAWQRSQDALAHAKKLRIETPLARAIRAARKAGVLQ